MVKNGTLASPATARAIRVLPVPGGPTSSTPRGMLAAEPLEFAGVAQELDDLLQVGFGLVDAGHVLEGDAAMRLGQKLGAALAEAERLAAGALHLARQENPHADQRDERQPRHQQRHEPRHAVALRPRGDRHALAVEALHQGRIVRRVGLEAAAVGEGAVDVRALDQDVADLARVDLVEKLRERDVLRGGALAGILEQREQREQQQDDDDPEGEVAEIGVHPKSSFLPRASWRAGWPAARLQAVIHDSSSQCRSAVAPCQGNRPGEKAPRIRRILTRSGRRVPKLAPNSFVYG